MSKLKDSLRRDKAKYPKQELKLSIKIPPSTNSAYFYRGNSKHQRAGTRKYIKALRKYVKKEIEKQNWKKDNPYVWYYADLYFYYPDRRRRDAHNCLEVLMDGLETVLYEDDYFVLPRIQKAVLDRENPRMEMIYKCQKKK